MRRGACQPIVGLFQKGSKRLASGDSSMKQARKGGEGIKGGQLAFDGGGVLGHLDRPGVRKRF